MAIPMTPTEITKQISRWGATAKAYKADWETHNRGQRGEGWGNVHGVVIHHTGSDDDVKDYLYRGTDALPGPLVQFYIDKLGIIWLIGWGRCNHAGGGDPAVLAHVINEDYIGTLTTHFGEGDTGAKDGNAYFYGIEVGYSGSHVMSPAQGASLIKLCGAIAEHHNWTEKSFIGHYEWNKYKWDPGCGPNEQRYSMSLMRSDIRRVILAGPTGSKPPVTNPIDTPDATNTTYEQGWHTDRMIPPKGHETKENPTWHPESVLRFAAEQAEEALIQARYNGAMLNKIMKHLNIS